MDDATRKLAAEKLDLVSNLIGYPEHWKDYSSLEITANAFVANVFLTNNFATSDQVLYYVTISISIFVNVCIVHHIIVLSVNIFPCALRTPQFSQLLVPVDKSRWQMTPPTVNAYYDPTLNEMVFPAGILQVNTQNSLSAAAHTSVVYVCV